MNQTWKTTIAIVMTAIVVGGGVYFWQSNQPEETLTREYLVSNEWGQEGSFGMQIKFNTDGTFDEHLAAETGDLPVSGVFEVKNNRVSLKVEKYADKTFDEAKKIYGSNAVYIPERTLTLEKSDSSLFFTHFLANNGRIAYWNRSSKVPEGDRREFESYILTTTQKDLKPKINAIAKERPIFYPKHPNYDGFDYSFNSCDPTCETGTTHALSEIYKGIIAKTQFKDTINGTEDYWYLAQITVPWYSVAKLRGEITTVSTAWIHGSELE